MSSVPPKVVVLDDDPTGTQTVHGVDVFTDGSVAELVSALSDPAPCCYLLTNSRSLPSEQAFELTREIAANLTEASRRTGRPFSAISRSDSTLRGHFPEETDALSASLGAPCDGTLLIPAFFEGGRITVGDVHYVQEGDRRIPAAETPFAKDATFGYAHSNLREWIEEKTRGRVSAGEVASVGLDLLRGPGGAGAARDLLLGLPQGAYVVVNAAAYSDLEVFVRGLVQAEKAGRHYVCRTAASFVRVRAGIEPRTLLTAREILTEGEPAGGAGGLVVVGSYVEKTTEQLHAALGLPGIAAVELFVDRLADPEGRREEARRVAAAAESALSAGRPALVYTSRGRVSALGRAGELSAGRIVSDALVSVVRSIGVRPRFIVAKGGITSSDLAVRGLNLRRARVLGQALPGVPVWRAGPESRFPGLSYIVFPGNVGGSAALGDLIVQLSAR
ncbi:MAG: four-carbon acid sugar kinase family protein [Opitutaceae bacterium]